MPTLHPVKNLEYVKESQTKKREILGVDAYNTISADVEQKHRDKLKATIGINEYKATRGIFERIQSNKKGIKIRCRKEGKINKYCCRCYNFL